MKRAEDLLSLSEARDIDRICDRFEKQWLAGANPNINEYLESERSVNRSRLLRSLLGVELELTSRDNKSVLVEAYWRRFPDDAELVSDVHREWSERLASGSAQEPVSGLSDTVKLDKPSVETAGDTAGDDSPEIPSVMGRFQIRGTLGKGGFGAVYRAYDPDLDREVALKIPRGGLFSDSQERERFLREARAAAGIKHRNICTVHDIGEIDAGLFIVMEYVEGKSLAEYLRRGKPVDQQQAAALVRKVAVALHQAHRGGIVHRDLKPSNIMIERGSREPIVMDFGLARRSRTDDVQLTLNGQVIGTPAYMSPEQARGDIESIGEASDIYSLGVILYELLCGRRPFCQESLADLLADIVCTSRPTILQTQTISVNSTMEHEIHTSVH